MMISWKIITLSPQINNLEVQLHILSKHKLFKYTINWSELHPELEYFTQEEKSAYIIYLDTVIHLFNTQEINPYLAVEDCYSGL